ncbi:hypothetical protein ABT024_05330 [Streptomyces sp. NPDC002812]|uniref:hypothetical protein n=1 Tax=Streptomyces sp. NPDC002812 TaxID=3154434 RepID=UPI0033307E61
MISSTTRQALLDRATIEPDDRISPATFKLFARHLRRTDIDLSTWHMCADIADSGPLTHHQARAAASQLVQCGLMERTVVARRVRKQDARYTAYRLSGIEQEVAGQ